MIVIRLNGELEEKLKTIALLKEVDKKDLIAELKRKTEEFVRNEIEREYQSVIGNV